jgi:hypothetical protein
MRDELGQPLWGAPRIHGELLKLGIDAGQTSVAKYMARRRRPPSQGWRTFSYSPEQKQLLRPREPRYCGMTCTSSYKAEVQPQAYRRQVSTPSAFDRGHRR